MAWIDTRRQEPDSYVHPTGYRNEAEFAELVLGRLEPHFTVHREVEGTHYSGQRLRIDSVLTPRDPREWKTPRVALGVEFKHPDNFYDRSGFTTGDYTRLLAQASDYAETRWDGFGLLYVLTCPSFVEGLPTSLAGVPAYAVRLAGQLGVGEVKFDRWRGWSLWLSAERLWSEAEGVKAGSRFRLVRKFGSR